MKKEYIIFFCININEIEFILVVIKEKFCLREVRKILKFVYEIFGKFDINLFIRKCKFLEEGMEGF